MAAVNFISFNTNHYSKNIIFYNIGEIQITVSTQDSVFLHSEIYKLPVEICNDSVATDIFLIFLC